MRVVITGDRNWDDDRPIDALICGMLGLAERSDEVLEVIHGGARGADTLAASWEGSKGVVILTFPADWKTYGKGAGPVRNRQMLDQEPDLVVAFHDELEVSKGTKDCVDEARRRGITVWHLRHLR